MNLEKILYEKFSYTQFRNGQREIIESVLNGTDTIALLPTGTGKSLCYQLPGYLVDGCVLIISPLLSLMQDQVEQLRAKGEKRVVAINSFLSFEEKKQVLRNIRYYKFIYISPEMLHNEGIKKILQSLTISLLVVDEAHCISQWGYDFRPDYLEIGTVRKQLGSPVTLALTATARQEVRDDIKRFLKLEMVNEIIFSSDRPNIAYMVQRVNGYEEKRTTLLSLVKQLQGPGIIYFSSKKLADEWAKLLNEATSYNVGAYHAGLDMEQRILLQQQFLFNELDIMCATSAFGMGINKENVRFVIHFHPPVDIESYLQEIGRAGRDGEKSIAILLYSPDDIHLQMQLMEGELPNSLQIEYFGQYMLQAKVTINNKEQSSMDTFLQQPLDGFSEVQWRLLRKFYLSSRDENTFKTSIQHFIEKRKQWKQIKLQEMNQWIISSGCRRENMLHYFNEEKNIDVLNCCDHCGITMEIYQKVHSIKKERLKLNWQERLQEIFAISLD
ncbi:RecQ family ATP-dependent DNA helicase [Caldibacillus lycopersici]|uniref:ATP-dependent DNA helicase RecQ n=1 Tax=Perspicuibacillus lycopersici TaxID=1325689 RepID=A0AAE3LTB0_9BACI|nr:ATP-dependent DNA helicase RecQ [Perspicuibacillus lycopersici]MCU9613738.1 RecQ family ATP-dependent DNA helicase [Perspicuibacillus lycopersici]